MVESTLHMEPSIEAAALRSCLEDADLKLNRAAQQLMGAVLHCEEEVMDDRKQVRYLKDACRAIGKVLTKTSDGIQECLDF